MPRRPPTRPRPQDPKAPSSGEVSGPPFIISGEVSGPPFIISSLANAPTRTGRKLVLLPEGEPRAGEQILRSMAGLRVQSASSSGAAVPEDGAAKLFPRLGVAVVAADDDQVAALRAASVEGVALPIAIEDEYILYAAGMDRSWLRGYRDAVDHIASHMLDDGPAEPMGAAAAGSPSDTWGVLVTGAARSARDGSGVRVAVLDTGLDWTHPDFRDQDISAESFISGETVQDGNGHGTHCAGVVWGAAPRGTSTRYGVAGGARLHVAKVLSDLGEGPEQSILQGIEWALEKECRIVSMSLSAQAAVSPLFERVGRRAMKAGTLLIAAAGNDSNRPSRIMPVGYPANCDSILAVAAIDRGMRVARFSNGGGTGGGRVDIAGPGVGVMSSWAGARRYKQESGTSMATPFVAGIACLLAQGNPGLGAAALAEMLLGAARKLDLAASDVGAGLVQAP